MILSGRVARIDRTRIVYGTGWEKLEKFISANRYFNGNIFILTDQNTRKYCLPVLLSRIPRLGNAVILEVPAGEENKTLQSAEFLWKQLFERQADRRTLLINLGGGVVTDLGGFIAAGFMRGIPCIHLPTSLMGQVDAAIGGKTAVNMNGIKNQIGFFYSPEAVFIFPEFLATIDKQHIRSGFAEILKTALVGDTDLLRMIMRQPVRLWMQLPVTGRPWGDLIQKTITLKNKVVRKDFSEKQYRKILNFGHTFGHAFEAMSQKSGNSPLLHGEAVALGMICETFLSSLKTGLPAQDRDSIVAYIREGFSACEFKPEDISGLMEVMQHDKKNKDGKIRFTLLRKPGMTKMDVPCTGDEIIMAYQFLINPVH